MAQGLFTLKQQLQGLIQKAWSGSIATNYVEYLVVGGGGSGGAGSYGAGGGAGGLLQGIVSVPTGTPLTVTIGAGGTGVASGSGAGNNGITSVFNNINAIGGGGGGGLSSSGKSGSSGGGGNGGDPTRGGQGTSGQGNAGGNGASSVGGGGGGAGTVGLNAPSGNGGAGIASAISGTVTNYAGGGGSYPSATGGVGGGGSTGNAGTANTGGGGGADAGGGSGAGGSGIVIISYPDIYSAPASFGGANSPTASTSGSGSLNFNGSSAITYPSNSAFNLGSSNFTIEMWVYKSTSGSQTFAAQVNSSLTATTWTFDIGTNSSNVIVAEVYVGSTAYTVTTSTAMSLSTWYHVAFVRNSGTLTVYVNGTSTGTASITGSVNSGSTPMTLGRLGDYTVSYYTNGYVSNFRYVTGTAVYTANFTPLTAPLTPISGTQLLLTTVSPDGYLDSSTNSFTPTLVSTPSWNQASPFATGLGYKNRVYTWTGSGTVTF